MTESTRTELLSIMHRFVEKEIDVATFVSTYQFAWKKWRDTNELYKPDKLHSSAYNRAFTAADCYQPETDYKTDWAIGENQLRSEISEIITEVQTINALPLAIGIGCKTGVSAGAIISLIEKACGQIDGKPAALYTAEEKCAEPALGEAARRLGLPLVPIARAALKEAAPRAVTKSSRVLALFGVPSVAETAALAGAGPGSQLVLPRVSADGVTCAIAASKETP